MCKALNTLWGKKVFENLSVEIHILHFVLTLCAENKRLHFQLLKAAESANAYYNTQRSNLRSSLMEFACRVPIWAFECLTPYI